VASTTNVEGLVNKTYSNLEEWYYVNDSLFSKNASTKILPL